MGILVRNRNLTLLLIANAVSVIGNVVTHGRTVADGMI